MDKYLFAADLHIRTTKPRFRTENNFFKEVGLPKLQWLVNLANTNSARLIIAGDLFHTTKIDILTVNIVIKELRKAVNMPYIVVGQHDLLYQSLDLSPSPIQTLLYAEVVRLLNTSEWNNCCGLSWGDEKTCDLDIQLLVMHKTVTENDPPFFLEDAISAKDVLAMYHKAQYICSGDYHRPHVFEQGNRALINPGSMLRMNRDQQDHIPRVYLLETSTNEITKIPFPITPASEAFNIRLIDIESNKKQLSVDVTDLVDALKQTTEFPDFPTALNIVMKKAGARPITFSIKDDVLETIK